MECSVSFETLINLFEGVLNDAEAAVVRRHIRESGCPVCAERWQWLEGSLPTLAGALTAPRPSNTGPLGRVAQFSRLLAAVRDPGVTPFLAEPLPLESPVPANAVLRGGLTPSRYQVYETPLHRITLWDEPDERETRYLIGQVYGREGDPLEPEEVRLLDAHGAIHTADRESGEFHLAGVPVGVCVLTCALPGAQNVVVPRVAVGLA